MELVDKLSARWGWRARGHVKVVWLDLPMPTRRRPPQVAPQPSPFHPHAIGPPSRGAPSDSSGSATHHQSQIRTDRRSPPRTESAAGRAPRAGAADRAQNSSGSLGRGLGSVQRIGIPWADPDPSCTAVPGRHGAHAPDAGHDRPTSA